MQICLSKVSKHRTKYIISVKNVYIMHSIEYISQVIIVAHDLLFCQFMFIQWFIDSAGGVMISMLDWVRYIVGSSHGLVKPKTMKLIFAAKHVTLRSKSNDWLAVNQDKVSNTRNTSMCNVFSSRYSWKIVHWS